MIVAQMKECWCVGPEQDALDAPRTAVHVAVHVAAMQEPVQEQGACPDQAK